MLAEATKKDPEFVRKVLDLVESGLSAEQVVASLSESQEAAQREIHESSLNAAAEVFPDEIKIIAQALAFRSPTDDDLPGISAVLQSAYSVDVAGDEAFLEAEGALISRESIADMLRDDAYHWVVMECPSGAGVVEDGTIIGVCCFTTDGVSKRNGVVEGKLGSIRYLGVLRQYHGVCLGRRLLSKIEYIMANKYECCRCMISVSSTRQTLQDWLNRRDYSQVAKQPYPLSSNMKLSKEGVELLLFVKPLSDPIPSATESNSLPQLKSITGKINMSPIWRMAGNAQQSSNIPDVD